MDKYTWQYIADAEALDGIPVDHRVQVCVYDVHTDIFLFFGAVWTGTFWTDADGQEFWKKGPIDIENDITPNDNKRYYVCGWSYSGEEKTMETPPAVVALNYWMGVWYESVRKRRRRKSG